MSGRSRGRFVTWLLSRALGARRAEPSDADLRRADHPSQTRGLGVRPDERLRDWWRPRWLRIHRAGGDGAG
ncbi:MAG: hypothetical protein U1A27_09180 [Phycisphaerae bacterium]